MKNIKESVWADIHKRSNGDQVRKEDDVNLLDLDEFYKYIKDHYKTKVEYIDLDAMGSGNGDVLGVDITENVILFYKPKRGHILLSWSRVKIPMPFFDELVDRFKIENPNAMRRIITEKDGSCTNKTFVDVIEFFIEHKETLVNESIWADIHKRSNGDQVRKEDDCLIDEKELDKDSLICIKRYVILSVYHDMYDGKPETFLKCIENWDDNISIRAQLYDKKKGEYVDPSKIIPPFIKKNWETGKSYKSCVNKKVSDVEDEIRKTGFVKKPGESINDTLSKWFNDNEDLISEEYWDSYEEYAERYYSEGGSRNTEIGVEDWWDSLEYIDQVKIYQEHMKNTNESVWTDIHKRSTGELVRKEDEMTQKDLDDLDKYITHFANEVVYGQGMGEEAATLDNFCDHIRQDYDVKDSDKDKIIEYVKKVWFDELCDDVSGTIEQVQKEYNQDMYESIWRDMHQRSNGEAVRKEDENLSDEDCDFLDDCLMEFATRVVWDGEKASQEKLSNCIRKQSNNYKGIDVERVIKYVYDHWSAVSEELDGLIAQEEKEKEDGMNESVWKDIHQRSTGEQVRKEDELLDDKENQILKQTAKMFKNAVRVSKYKDDDEGYDYSDSKEDFIYYIEQRKGEMFWTGVKEDVYDKIIDYVSKKWTDGCKGIDEFISEYIYECDGVPGGITPADVGGMGAITFPGADGTPGSGDIPMPTGHVYQQVAPFGIFIRAKKGKKRKKKFRKEDEPCAHSPNAKVYDYVDDYREYVDRTYNNMDRRK